MQRTDDERAFFVGEARAEEVAVSRVGRRERRRVLRPRRARTGEDIDRAARARRSPDLSEVATDEDGVAADGDGVPELVVGYSVGGRQLLLLRPRRAVARIDVGRALPRVAADLIGGRADDRVVARNGDAEAETVLTRAVVRQQPPLLDVPALSRRFERVVDAALAQELRCLRAEQLTRRRGFSGGAASTEKAESSFGLRRLKTRPAVSST